MKASNTSSMGLRRSNAGTEGRPPWIATISGATTRIMMDVHPVRTTSMRSRSYASRNTGTSTSTKHPPVLLRTLRRAADSWGPSLWDVPARGSRRGMCGRAPGARLNRYTGSAPDRYVSLCPGDITTADGITLRRGYSRIGASRKRRGGSLPQEWYRCREVCGSMERQAFCVAATPISVFDPHTTFGYLGLT